MLELMEFVRLVAEMRRRQVEYFRTKDATVLRIARDYERRVDAAVSAYQDGPDLFSQSEVPDER